MLVLHHTAAIFSQLAKFFQGGGVGVETQPGGAGFEIVPGGTPLRAPPTLVTYGHTPP